MNCLLLNSLNAELLEFLIKDLTKIHHHGFVDFLPQMGSEDLDQGDLERGNFAMQENPGQI